LGWKSQNAFAGGHAYLYICHFCTQVTMFAPGGKQTPGAVFGEAVSGITDDSVRMLYDEARRTMATESYTAAVLSCRKLLMHISVAKGAKAGESFITYIEYLAEKNFIPPDAKEWVDHIRAKGNEANHQIVIMQRSDAEQLLAFCEMLLKIIFEFPSAMKKTVAPTS
jgi:hypothetical protein